MALYKYVYCYYYVCYVPCASDSSQHFIIRYHTALQCMAQDQVCIPHLTRSVCLLVTSVMPAKMAEPIQMQFGLWTPIDPRNLAVGEGPDLPMPRGSFGEVLGHLQTCV